MGIYFPRKLLPPQPIFAILNAINEQNAGTVAILFLIFVEIIMSFADRPSSSHSIAQFINIASRHRVRIFQKRYEMPRSHSDFTDL